MDRVQIGNRWIDAEAPAYVVAEISANHNQSLERAMEIIRAAKRSGADAIKLQTYTADTMTIDCDQPWFRVSGDSIWSGTTLYQLYSQAYTPWEWHTKLQTQASDLGLTLFSTPFDASAVDFLETLQVPAYKVASFELVDIPLLRKIARTKKPVIASTGLASFAEIEEAVQTLRANGTSELVLLKCTSAYPASPAEMNLRTIPHLSSAFNTVVGLSDHTLGSSTAIAAVALGARVIEKHFTLNRADGGPDSSFSMEPAEFAQMVNDIRRVEQALGEVNYSRTPDETKNLVFRRSLFVVQDIKRGELFTDHNVRSIRPSQGLHTRYLAEVLGKKATRDISRGTPLGWDMVSG
jgi:pseudaminic acid synthase